jgi:hypothetical protein
MRIKAIIVSLALCAVGLGAGPSLAAEYYVIKSRSGILMIRDHKPQRSATIVKGPFKTRQEAADALRKADVGGSDRKPTAK